MLEHLITTQKMRLFLFIALIMLLEAYGFTVETDRKALLDFKSQVSVDKQVVLSSWNNSVHVCNWKGVTCGLKHKRVTRLDLGRLQLGGVISPYIGNLSFLISLDLSNNNFGGTIPHEVGNLLRLDYLDMGYNSLVGAIPISLFNCSRLSELYLNSNPLGGVVPPEAGSLTNLVNLALERNKLKGSLPASFGNLTSLMRVNLRDNNIEGDIPDDIGRLNQMVELYLAANKFSGVLPSSIYNLSSLKLLTIRDNHLSGFLRPDTDKLLPNLLFLNMGGNYFKGAIPASLANISSLQMLSLNANNLTGGIPSSFGKLQSLSLLSLYNNSLGSHSSGDLEFLGALTNCTQLNTLYLFGNGLGGHLPTTSITNLSTSLRVLDLGTNSIFGSIPHGIGNLINLQSLALDGNHLTGLVPASIGKLLQLEVLDLVSNNLSGEIPSLLGNLTRLDALVLANNSFEGTIPPSLSNCTFLRYLIVELNKLNGTIPQEITQIQSLVELSVSRNYLTGSLPKDVGRLDHLVHLSLEHNRLFGQIPPSLGKCLTLELLFLQGNYFDGVIPDMKGLEGLKKLDFSNNNLSGRIPRYLANFSSLEYLNLSVNNFEGSVPTEGKFRNATIVSVFGNKNLCGGIKEFKLKPCFTTKAPSMGSERSSLLKKVVIGISVGITLLLLLLVTSVSLRWFRKRKKKTQQTNKNQTPSTLEVFFPKMSYGEIRNATDGFSSRNMIGSGSFGTVFRAFLPAENKAVAVKVLNMQRRGAMKSFMAECESLKETRHRNLVKLLTACSSIDFQGNMFRALVYEYMPNGSLDAWLHPEEVEEIRRPSKTLTLLERLDIAIDVASVLEYLHVRCHEPIVHCDIKPTNILLDNDLTAHVSDFGLARLLLKFDQESFLNQLSSAGVRGTTGYAAPEYGVGGKPSTHGDVYSFGVLVLEMLTGKRPTDELFEGNFTLRSYIKSVLPEQVLDIADKSFFNSGLIVGFPIAECLTLVLGVGLRCSEESPTNRVEMSEAMKELISIREKFFKARRTARG